MSESLWSSTNSLTTKSNYIPNAEEAILTANNSAQYTYFGRSVAISDDGLRIVIGRSDDAGGAYIFFKSSGSWTLETKIATPQANSMFGQTVAIDSTGTRVAVGAPNGDYGGYTDTGFILIYTRTGTTWNIEVTLIMTSPWYSDRLGDSIAFDLNATRCIAGASGAVVGGGTNTGKVAIFTRTGTTWSTEQILNAPDYAFGDRFGISVDCDDTATRIIIGAHVGDRSGAQDTGKAYIYARSGTTWTHETTLTSVLTNQYDQYGGSVTISSDGSRVAIGCKYATTGAYSFSGKVFIYTRTGTTWTEETVLAHSPIVDQDQFGSFVKFNAAADKLVIAASYKSTQSTTNRAGVVFIYTRTGTNWFLSATLNPSIPYMNMSFGTSIDITANGTKLVISAAASDTVFDDAGAAYVFS